MPTKRYGEQEEEEGDPRVYYPGRVIPMHAPLNILLLSLMTLFFVQPLHLQFFATFADAHVGDESSGMDLNVQQILPAGSWQRHEEGGCFLGKAMHLVVDPDKADFSQIFVDSYSTGRYLCEWLDSVVARHYRNSLRHPPSSSTQGGVLQKFISMEPKSSKISDSFTSALQVTLHHLNLQDYMEYPGSIGHIPLPWAIVSFSYYPLETGANRKPLKPVHFCKEDPHCENPDRVYLLLTPEMHTDTTEDEGTENTAFTPSSAPTRSQSWTAVEDEATEEEALDDSTKAFQMLLVRNFMWLAPECVCLDGRLVSREYDLCVWAEVQKRDYPFASATFIFHSVSLFTDSLAHITGRLQLENPHYSLYARKTTLYVKPLQSRAALTRKHYYGSDL